MVELEPGWMPSTKLNAVAAEVDVLDDEPLPDDVTRDEIEEYCYTLRQMYGRYVDELLDNTELSRREAQTWALRNLVFDEGERLCYEAIGLYIWAIGRATDGDPLSRTIVSDYHERAEDKIERAEETVKRTGPPPYPDEQFAEPTMLWVEGTTGQRLQRRLGPDENFDDLVRRLLDETLTSVSLADLVSQYRDERDSAYVAVDTVYPEWDRRLRVVVHASAGAKTPPAVADAEALVVDDTPYDFEVSERKSIPEGRSQIPVFVAESTATPDAHAAVSLEEGRERLLAALAAAALPPSDLVDRLRDAGAVGVAVADEPVGTGAALRVIVPEDASVDGPFEYLDRIPLDDRTVSVEHVERVSVDDYERIADDSTLLWASADAEGVPTRTLPDDLTEQRKRFPTAVLWTD